MSSNINQLNQILTEEIKSWYVSKIREFHLAVNDSGKVLYFSEQALDFFTFFAPGKGEEKEYKLEDLINSNDTEIILTAMHNSQDSEGEVELLSPLNGATYKALWKEIGQGKESFFLVFQKEENEMGRQYQLDGSIIEELPFAATIIENENFSTRNSHLTALLYELNIEDMAGLKSYLAEKSDNSSAFFSGVKRVFEAKIERENDLLVIHGAYLAQGSSKIFLSIVKEEIREKIIEKEILVESPAAAQDTGLEAEGQVGKKSIIDSQKLRTLSYDIENSINSIIDTLEGDTSELINRAKDDYRDVGEALKGTSQNLLKMSEIAQFIEDVSIKIHMISINAAIESARAGETGKGFSVIAREIRKLSEETKSYTKMIGTEIEKIIAFTEQMFSSDELEQNNSEIGTLLEQYQAKVKGLISSLKQSAINQISSLS